MKGTHVSVLNHQLKERETRSLERVNYNDPFGTVVRSTDLV